MEFPHQLAHTFWVCFDVNINVDIVVAIDIDSVLDISSDINIDKRLAVIHRGGSE